MPRHPPTDLPLAGRQVAVVNWRDLDHSLAGGSERYAWEFARALAEAGAAVEFVTARDTGQRRRDRRDGISIRRGGGPLTFYLHAAWYLATRRRRLDVVIDPECGIPAFSPLFVRRSTAVVLLVHHVHQAQFETYFRPPMSTLGQFLEGRLMPWVYRRVPTYAVSSSTAYEMRDQLGWRRPIGLLQNGADGAADSGPLADKDPRRLLVLGRLVPHKRVDRVVRAAGVLARELPGLHVDVVGRGPEREALVALVEELGLDAVVTIHGFLDEEAKAAVLRRTGLHVCASDIEGWGQVVIEAAAFGMPTVGRDVPGLRDSIRDGETGWLMPDPGIGDALESQLVDRLREAITQLEDPVRHREMYDAARAWAAGFSWSRMHREALDATLDALLRTPRQD